MGVREGAGEGEGEGEVSKGLLIGPGLTSSIMKPWSR